jgi:hypothetical protein
MTLQPILVPVKGAPDIILSVNPQYPDELYVFLGMALLERVPRLRDHIAFKMLLARLYNAKVRVRTLVECFGVAHTTLRRWGLALLSGDLDRIKRAFCGQGAERKMSPEIEGYVRDRFRELYGNCRDYSQKIRKEVEKYFKTEVSAERLRWIFAEERENIAQAPEEVIPEAEETDAQEGQENFEYDGINTEFEADERANSCEVEMNSSDLERSIPAQGNNCLRYDELSKLDSGKLSENDSINLTPNNSLCKGQMLYSGQPMPDKPKLVHHAGLVLLTPWLDQVTGDLTKHRNIIRQWFAQVLLGAVNHERSKILSFSSLELIVGPSVRSLNRQRYWLGQLASLEHTVSILKRNNRILNLSDQRIFYYDPHVAEYTGFLKILKGWCGGMGRVNKVLKLDFIHSLNGSPCFVQHFDSYYDLRERFFMCTAAFRRILPGEERSLTWIADRGIYSLKALQRVIEMGDHIITWEKAYARDGWDDSKASESFIHLRPRNYATDLLTYEFSWQESVWVRDSRFRRIVVRARNPNGNEIEVAILASDGKQSAQQIIMVIFSRWLQENDFAYLIDHFGINELTSRAYESYSSLETELTDRQVRSREYKALMQKKSKVESTLSRLLLKRQKHEKLVIKKRQEGEAKRKSLEAECQDRESQLKGLASDSNQKSYRQLEREREKCHRRLEKLLAKLAKEEEAGKEKGKELEANIRNKSEELENFEKSLMETVRDESRMQALIEEQYFRLDMRRKAFMDAVRLSCRNIFYCLMDIFRPLYNNYRDDHVILRELTRAMGIVEKRDGVINIQLLPAMELQPKVKQIVSTFLEQMSKRINHYYTGRCLPIHIQLLADQSDLFGRGSRN